MYLFLLGMYIVYFHISFCICKYVCHSVFVFALGSVLAPTQCPPIQKLLTNPPYVLYDSRLSSFAEDFWSMSVLYLWQEEE